MKKQYYASPPPLRSSPSPRTLRRRSGQAWRGGWGVTSLNLLLLILFFVTSNSVYSNTFGAYGVGKYMGQSGSGAALVYDQNAAFMNPAGLAYPRGIDFFKKEFNFFEKRAETKVEEVPIEKPVFDEQGEKIRLERPAMINLTDQGEKAPMTDDKEPPIHFLGIGYKQVFGGLKIAPSGNNPWANKKVRDQEESLGTSILELGAVIDARALVTIPWNIPVKIGFLGHINPGGSVASPVTLSESSYNFVRAGNNVNVISIQVSAGVQVWKNRLSIGVGQDSNTDVKGHMYVRNISLNETTPLYVNAKVNLKSTPSPTASILYRQPIKTGYDLFLTFIYRGRVDVSSEVTTDVDLPLGISSSSTTVGKMMVLPHRFVFGSALVWSIFKTALDFDYHKWSDAKLNPALEALEHPLWFKDSFIIRTGFDSELPFHPFLKKYLVKARTGYAYVSPYTPDQTQWSNYLDNHKHIFSLGGSMVLPALGIMKYPVMLDLSFQWQYWVPRETKKDGAYTFPDNSIQPNYNYGGNIFQLQMNFTWKF